MSENYANPLQGAETDLQKAQKAVNGLLNAPEEKETGETPKEIQQNSPEPQNEESEVDQPQEQEITKKNLMMKLPKMYLKTKNKLILKRNKIPPKKPSQSESCWSRI